MHTENKLLELAIKHHKEFVDDMFPLFGIDNHPGYASVEIRPMFSNGKASYCPDRIFINDTLGFNEVEITTYEESAHILHPFAKKYYAKHGKMVPRNHFLGEIVGPLGSLVYLERKYSGTRRTI